MHCVNYRDASAIYAVAKNMFENKKITITCQDITRLKIA
jgi:hypothetical protein